MSIRTDAEHDLMEAHRLLQEAVALEKRAARLRENASLLTDAIRNPDCDDAPKDAQ